MNTKLTFSEWFAIIFFIFIVGICVGDIIISNTDKRTITLTVTEKTVKTDGREGRYLVYCKGADDQINVLEISDTLWHGRFNSSDEYAAIEVGKTYRFTVVGKRIPIFSMYPNILSHKEE